MDRHTRLLAKLDERAGTQRGKPRSREPARNPLGGLIYDMGCSWAMYRQPYKGSFRYTCGLYQQSHGAQCRHNHVDGLLVTRFLLGCVRQRLLAPAAHAKLEQRLRAIAEREHRHGQHDEALQAKQSALASVRAQGERVGENLARAEGPAQYRAIAEVFDRLCEQEQSLDAEVHQLQQDGGRICDTDAEVAAALARMDRLAESVAAAQDLGAIGGLFRELNARVFLRFTQALLKK